MAAITLEELLEEVSVCPEKLNESISDDHLREIGIFLTSWRKVATYLELSESDLDAIEREEKDDQMKKLKALQKWKGKFGFKATYRKLVEILLSLAMADVAEKVCRLLKGTTDSNRAETETQLQEKNAAEIERLQQELKLQRDQNAERLAAVQSQLQQLRAEMDARSAQVQQQLREKDAEINRLERGLRDQTASRDESVATILSPSKKPKLYQPSKLTLTSRRLQDMLETLQNPCSVTVDTVVYVTGNRYFTYRDSDIYRYDPQTQQWSKLPEYQYWAFTMTAVDNKLVLVGGQDKPTRDKFTFSKPKAIASDAVAMYSPSQGSWEHPYPSMNTPRYYPAVATYKQHLVVAGGCDGDGRDRCALAAVEILNTSTSHGQWLSITSMSLPTSCSQMSSAIVHDTLYLLGGSLQCQVFSVSLSALTQTDKSPTQWRTLPDAPLQYSMAIAVHGSLLAVGGKSLGCRQSSAIHVYDQEKNMWTKFGDLTTARSSCACCLLPGGKILIVGGQDRNGQWTTQMEMATVTMWD